MRTLIVLILCLIPTVVNAQVMSRQVGPGRVGYTPTGESEQDKLHRLIHERDRRETAQQKRDDAIRRAQQAYNAKAARWREYQRENSGTTLLHPNGGRSYGGSWDDFQRSERLQGN